MTAPHDVVFLLDVDNTLLGNDRIIADLRLHLGREFGAANAGRYWTIFEQLRSELGYADYLGVLQRYRSDSERKSCDDWGLLQMSPFLVDYFFADRLYSHALDVIKRLTGFGPTVIHLRWRRRLPAAQDSALGPLERRQRPGPDLHPQGTNA